MLRKIRLLQEHVVIMLPRLRNSSCGTFRRDESARKALVERSDLLVEVKTVFETSARRASGERFRRPFGQADSRYRGYLGFQTRNVHARATRDLRPSGDREIETFRMNGSNSCRLGLRSRASRPNRVRARQVEDKSDSQHTDNYGDQPHLDANQGF